MSRHTLQRAPDPHAAPPVAIATRRDLFGTMGAMLLLSAAEAGQAKAAELDGDLLACCAAFQEAMREHNAANYAPALTEERSLALWQAKVATYDEVIRLPARTPEGLMAKARALQTAMRSDVPEYLHNTFDDCAEPHERLADSLCRDLLGRAGA